MIGKLIKLPNDFNRGKLAQLSNNAPCAYLIELLENSKADINDRWKDISDNEDLAQLKGARKMIDEVLYIMNRGHSWLDQEGE